MGRHSSFLEALIFSCAGPPVSSSILVRMSDQASAACPSPRRSYRLSAALILGRELIKFARSSSLWKPEDPITDQNDRNFRRQIGHQHKGGLTIGDQAYAPARREAAREQDRSQDGRILVFVVVGRVEPERCQSEIKAREGSLLFGFCV